jgi:hypothetical protein
MPDRRATLLSVTSVARQSNLRRRFRTSVNAPFTGTATPTLTGGQSGYETGESGMTDDSGGDYDAAAEIQKFIDEAVEKHGEEYVAANIDGLLAGLRPVMQVPEKDELDIPGDGENSSE